MLSTSVGKSDSVKLLLHAKTVKYKKGEIILRSFDDRKHMYEICSGLVKVYSLTPDGGENIIVIYGRDDLFPLDWIIEQQTQNVYFQAISDTEVYEMPKGMFLAQLKNDPDMTYAVMQQIVKQLYLLSSRVTNLGFKYARERLAYRLLLLSARFGIKKDGFMELPHITQQDLSATLNVSRENVSRELNRLVGKGTITYGRDVIRIFNPQALQKELGDNVTVMFRDNE